MAEIKRKAKSGTTTNHSASAPWVGVLMLVFVADLVVVVLVMTALMTVMVMVVVAMMAVPLCPFSLQDAAWILRLKCRHEIDSSGIRTRDY